jgi:hypothetical protein
MAVCTPKLNRLMPITSSAPPTKNEIKMLLGMGAIEKHRATIIRIIGAVDLTDSEKFCLIILLNFFNRSPLYIFI